MTSPEGWEEPGQRPEFDEWTLVLEGRLRVEHDGGELEVRAGQAVIARAGEWIRYSSARGRRRALRRDLPAGVLAGHGQSRRVAQRAHSP